MAITIGNVGSIGSSGTVTSLSLTMTISASTTMLAVTVYFDAATDPTGVTVNSLAMTKGRAENDGVINSSVWYYANPPTGSQTIIASFGSSATANVGGICLLGTDTTIGATDIATGTSTVFAGTITTTVDNSMIILSMSLSSGGTATPTAPLTAQYQQANSGGSVNVGATDLTTTAGLYTLTGSLSTLTRWPMAMVEFKPAAAAGATTPTTPTMLMMGVGL